MCKEKALPFLKWAGGKRQLLNQFEELYPCKLKNKEILKYVEPFVGGGAVFFELQKKYNFKEVVLNDINIEIITAYKIIRDKISQLLKELSNLEKEFLNKDLEKREEMYYDIRLKFNENKRSIDYDEVNYSSDLICHISHLIFLNRTCFNGLYRLNKSGDFNVPFGKYKNPTICNIDNLKNVHASLQGVKLVHGEFLEVEKNINIDENTFVYCDPPYRPITATSFKSYSKSDFNDSKQEQLALWFKKLDSENKALLMFSNSNPKNVNPDDDFFEDLYLSEGITITTVNASRTINSNANERGKISELVIKNY